MPPIAKEILRYQILWLVTAKEEDIITSPVPRSCISYNEDPMSIENDTQLIQQEAQSQSE